MAAAHFIAPVVDCADPRVLGEFYASFTDGEITNADEGWAQLNLPEGRIIAFQRVDDYRPPTWPDGETPQQIHLDFGVDDLDAGERALIELGAVKAAIQPDPTDARVFLDPAGHPFCLVAHSSGA